MIIAIHCSKSRPLFVEIAKWRDNHRGAISITIDEAGILSPAMRACQKLIADRKMTADFEIITANYESREDLRHHLKDVLIPSGFGYYGHGHEHVDHDRLPMERARESFRRCFDDMKALGLNPVAYAYPRGVGSKSETRRALAASGFLSARVAGYRKRPSPLIMPGEERQPEDWMRLPSLVMMDPSAKGGGRHVHDNKALLPFLDAATARKAWLILLYHRIGRPRRYGYYPMREFKKDLDAIRGRDLWNASMNDVTLYAYERARARSTVKAIRGRSHEYELVLSDGLENSRFNRPLTLIVHPDGDWKGRTIVVLQKGIEVASQKVGDHADILLSLLPNEESYTLKVR